MDAWMLTADIRFGCTERARSISPQKSSPANTPPPANRSSTPAPQYPTSESSPVIGPPASPKSPGDSSQSVDSMATQDFFSGLTSKENQAPFDAENKQASNPLSPTRSATVRGLNWQRRPNSQASNGPRSRPLSIVAAENAARSSTIPSEPSPATEAISRDQISHALSSKDPSWFRQTTDRGATSGAYRKNQVEDVERTDTSASRAQLPGMARRPSSDPVQEESRAVPDISGLPRGLGSPLSLTSSQRLNPPKDDDMPETDGTTEEQSMASPLGQTSPTRSDRPVSPTKGLGGFVQSAMMKRSDSVNKRWSVRTPEGLHRADTVSSNRSSYIGPRDTASTLSRPISFRRETAGESVSRPGSSQGQPDTAAEESISRKISDSLKTGPQSTPEQDSQNEDRTTPPSSPSKITDPRRWSPTKASWLESALNKPESPKPKPSTPTSNQPAWLAEIAKAKAQKATNTGAEPPRTPTVSHKHQVSIGGLMRASAPGIGASPASTPTIATHRTGGTPTVATHRTGSTPVATHRTGYGSMRNNSFDSTAATESTGEVKNTRERASTTASSYVSKPRLETPPKRDFRANLKPRESPHSGTAGAPEFKNVFGSLRKTATQNYVAPDELKTNILRGKAGLSNTGGPKKTERVDDFKEAILARKKEFNQVQSEGRGITPNSSTTSEQPVPEGLIKKFEIGRSNTVRRDSTFAGAPASRDTVRGHEKRDSTYNTPFTEERRPSIGTQRGSAQGVINSGVVGEPTAVPSLHKETSAPGRLQGKVGGSVLAKRFNPALAGLLARGPPSMASGCSDDTGASSTSTTEPAEGPKLAHLTKNRARGPKRRAPTSVAVATPSSTTESLKVVEDHIPNAPKSVLQAVQIRSPTTFSGSGATPIVESPKQKSENPPQLRPKPPPIALANSSSPLPQPTEDEPAKTRSSTRSHVRTKSRVFEQVAAFGGQSSPSPTKELESQKTGSQPSSPRKLNLNRMSRFGGDFSPVKSPENEGSQDQKLVVQDLKSEPPFKKPDSPTASRPEVRSPPPRLAGRPVPEPEKLTMQPSAEVRQAIRPISSHGNSALGTRGLPALSSPIKSISIKPRPPPIEPPSIRALPTSNPMSPAPLASPMRSPSKQAAETTSVLTEFFGPNRPKRDYRVDSTELLMQRPGTSPPKIRSLNAQLFQLSADGKRVPVPAHHDRVLFEREMYLCSHTFENENGWKATEVFFWVGDAVTTSDVEDASVFLAREARALGGKLIKLQQGKESSEFLAALGGIVITRRGSSNKYDSLAPHMMCGRRYLGQIVFDEVDLTPTSLCSGFPFLITSSGRCYLWKGKGSGADELSCARLVAMDSALSGELEEIEDGHETTRFWGLFGGGSRAGSADHWRLKPNYDKYCSRLFHSDADSKQQVSTHP